MSKRDLYRWAEGQTDLAPTVKAALTKMVALSDRDGRFWIAVETLGRHLNLRRRRVQQIMSELRTRELIALTGIHHRAGVSWLPLYQLLAPGYGAQSSAPSAEPECSEVRGERCNGVRPQRDKRRQEEGSNEPSIGEGFASALRLHPEVGRARTNVRQAIVLWAQVAEQEGEERLARAHAQWVAVYQASPTGKGPPGLDTWLRNGSYLAFLDRAGPFSAATADCEIPTDIVSAYGREFGEDRLVTLRRCGWREADRTLIAPTSWAMTMLQRECRHFLREHKLQVERARR